MLVPGFTLSTCTWGTLLTVVRSAIETAPVEASIAPTSFVREYRMAQPPMVQEKQPRDPGALPGGEALRGDLLTSDELQREQSAVSFQVTNVQKGPRSGVVPREGL
jgi:hypothetical protein